MKQIIILFGILFMVKNSFSQWTTSGSNIYYNSGNVGIGTTTPWTLVDVGSTIKSTYAAPDNSVTGLQSRTSSNLTTGFKLGSYFYHIQTASNTSGNLALGGYLVTANPSGTIGFGHGAQAHLEHSGSGTLTWGRGMLAAGLNTGNGNITNWASFAAGGITITGSGTVTNGYGIYISALPPAVTNKYGVYVADAAATNYFAGKVVLAGSSPALQISTGAGAAKVLTSDASGNATWQTASGGTGWGLTGNAGTVDGTNFIGTTDNVPFSIRVNNEKSGRIDPILQNTFYGQRAGRDNTTGTVNTAVGFEALTYNTTGLGNTAYGYSALQYSTAGDANTAIGTHALHGFPFTSTGNHNTAVGNVALFNTRNADYNTAVGSQALNFNTTGGNNTGIGLNALYTNTTGMTNTALGSSADVSSGALTNATAIGYGAIANANNKIVIGNTTSGIIIGGYAAWTNLISDGRFKENVKEDVPGLIFITKLRPVTYTINTKKLDEHIMQDMPDSIKAKRMQKNEVYSKASSKIQTGFIAQEVEKAVNELGYNFDGVNSPQNATDNYSIAYSQFVIPLVKAVQELSKQNEEMKIELDELKALIKGNTEGSIKISGASEAKLFQNSPNPFNQSTFIKYTIPATAKKAVITITSISGVKIRELSLNNKAESIQITEGQLSAGTYIYSLIVDDIFIDSKQMILTR